MLSSPTIANVALLGHLACLTTCFLHRPFIALSLESSVLGVNFLFMQLWMWSHHRASRRSWALLVAFVGIQSAFWWFTVYIDSVLKKGWIYGVHWNAPEFEKGMVAGVPASVLVGAAPLGPYDDTIFHTYLSYASLILTDIITFGAATRTSSTHRSSFLQLPLLALLDATLFTAYDLCVDPISTAAKLYFWQDAIDHPELTYFGVPVQNYVGWMLTMGAFFFVYRSIEYFVPPAPVQGNNDRGLFIWAPVLAFIWNLAWLVAQAPSNALRLVMIAAMGAPALMAASRIFARIELGEQEGERKGVWDGEVTYENSGDGKAKNL